ncbi:TlpA disulfide reductase family protein [Plebeiibacterium marinum]|uniref:AhpC/TSA family protein n=1 Tax=Plebeiibacterium marinum TaxID=2992111 RepID=A0AAE3MFT1_9BACT|nr:TlpA disulfide reductase family protein [Plebeiobacterium marinum]MCW3806641.1 AhpC/TSA family protein [Plebeiobacterium marinum]
MKNILYLLALVLIATSCTQGYTLKGKLTGVEDGTKIALRPFALFDVKTVAETVLEDGEFTFSGAVEEPREFYIEIGENQGRYRVMIENSKIQLSANLSLQSRGQNRGTYYDFKEVEVTGSESHNYLYSQLAVRDDLNELYKGLMDKFKKSENLAKEAEVDADKAILYQKECEEYQKAEKAFFDTVKKRYNQVFIDNKESFWGPLLMMNLLSYLTPEQRKTFENMSEKARNSYYGKMAAEKLYPAEMIGKKAPDFKVVGIDGKEQSLQEMLKGKKALLIDFWASWCGPCKKEIPHLKENYKRFSDKGFEIVSISIDKDEKAWLNSVEKLALKWPNFRDSEVSALYKVSAVPTMYLINSKGEIIGENLRGEALTKKLEEIF